MKKRYSQIKLPSPNDHDPHPRLLVDGYGIHAGDSFRSEEHTSELQSQR